MVTTSEVRTVVEAVVAEFREKNITFLAGSIAYNAFVSLVPLLLFVVLSLAVVGAGWQDRFLRLVTGNVSPTVGRLIQRIFESQSSSTAGSSLLGLLVLLWGALKLFRGLDTAFDEIYDVDADPSFVDKLEDGGAVLVSLVLAATGMVVATSVFGALVGRLPFSGVLVPLALAVGLVFVFLPMYYIFPNVSVSVREVLPGVAVAAVGWALLQGVFQLYVAVAGESGAGTVAGIMLLLTWLYFSAVVLLLGAVVNAIRGGYAGAARRAAAA